MATADNLSQGQPYYGLSSKIDRGVPIVRTISPRNIIVALEDSKPIGFIGKVKWGQNRSVQPRYEMGLEEVSYLAPGAIEGDQNLIDLDRFLVFPNR